jgi:tetraacyldisaccharide 4'-kinase
LQKLLPLGSLRESFSQIKRANFIVLTRADYNAVLKQKYLKLIQKYTPNTPLYELKENLYFTENGQKTNLSYKKVLVFCGLGNPRQFVFSLNKHNLQIQKTLFYPDHFAYDDKSIEDIYKQLQNCEAEIAITTSKDASKLNLNNLPFRLAIANLEFSNLDNLKISLQNEFGNLF